MNVPPSKKAHLAIEAADTAAFEAEKEAIARLAYCSGVEVAQSVPQAEGSVTVVTAACRAYLPMDDLVDKKAETARLTKELEGAKKQLATAEAKLRNEKFIIKAPQKVIDGVKDLPLCAGFPGAFPDRRGDDPQGGAGGRGGDPGPHRRPV